MNSQGLVIRNLSKQYFKPHPKTVIDGFNLHIPPGQSLALFGENGCGKSTLLNCIAGAVAYDGVITLDGEPVVFGETKTGMVWQDTTSILLPFFKGLRNAAIGLELKMIKSRPGLLEVLKRNTIGRKRFWDEVYERTRAVMRELNVPAYLEDRYPGQMSGGERQLISLTRILAIEPDIILADEPTHALDFKRKAEVQQILVDVIAQRRCITLVVTHDPEEAILTCDRSIALGSDPLTQLTTIESPFPWPRNIDELTTSSAVQERRAMLTRAIETHRVSIEGVRGKELTH